MPSRSSNLASSSLALAFTAAGYLTHKCWSPPSVTPPSTSSSLPEDTFGISSSAIQGRRIFILVAWAIHILTTIYYPSNSLLLCPNQQNLSNTLFTWSPYTITVLSVIAVAAPIRLIAFKQLGQNFTFRLANPNELITTGLYAYVQHPSYPANWLLLTANFTILLRPDGIVGCILPDWLVMGTLYAWPLLLLVFAILGLLGIMVRVREEEAMLKRQFGKEWEEYHRKTKRFIPGMF